MRKLTGTSWQTVLLALVVLASASATSASPWVTQPYAGPGADGSIVAASSSATLQDAPSPLRETHAHPDPYGSYAAVPRSAPVTPVAEFPAQGAHAVAMTQATSNFSLSPGPSPSAEDLTIVTGFEGLHYGVNSGYANNISPPDVPMAAGPSHIVQLVNGLAAIWQKDGTAVSTLLLPVFLGATPTDGVGNPRVLFDNSSGRWFASAADFTTGAVLLSVSTSSDPTASWNHVNLTSGGRCPDEPLLGMSDDKVVLMANVFTTCTGSFLGGEIWVLNKSDLVSGSAPRMTVFGPSTGYYSMFPVQSLSPTTTQYLVRVVPTDFVRLYALTGAPPDAVSLTSMDFPIVSFGLAVDAVQQGTTYLLDTGDTRVRDASWNAGRLWLAFNDGCVPASDSTTRSCFRIVGIDTVGKFLLQDFDVGAAGMYYFYPSLREDALGNLVVVFGYSSPGVYPSAAVTYRIPADPGGALRPPITVRSGTGPETPAAGICNASNVCRWGEYYATGVDPANGSLVWSAAEYGTSSGYATYISAAHVPALPAVILMLNYGVQGGGTGYAAPTLSFVQDGTARSATLTATPTVYAVDAGSSWNVTNPLAGSTTSERWSTSQPTNGTASVSGTMVFVYTHQLAADFGYQVQGGGSGFAAPSVTFTDHGIASTTTAIGAGVWADSGTAYEYQGSLPGSSDKESWRTNEASGTVASSGTYAATYQHQYYIGFEASSQSGGSLPQSPLLNVTLFGSTVSIPCDGAGWVDAGGWYSYPAIFYGPRSGERWTTDTPPTGQVLAPGNVTASYWHQFFLTVQRNTDAGGDAMLSSGWYNESASLSLRANANPGWRLEGWIGSGNGSYSGDDGNATITMEAPVTETALFYAGLVLGAGEGGSVAYAYGTMEGLVPSGTDVTIYLAPGTALAATAAPSWFHEFQGWSGLASGQSTVSLTIAAPSAVSANFGVSLYSKVDSVLGVTLASASMVALAFAARRRRRRKRRGMAQEPGQEQEP